MVRAFFVSVCIKYTFLTAQMAYHHSRLHPIGGGGVQLCTITNTIDDVHQLWRSNMHR